ncbi:dihydroorotate dehydrogenase-like protein [Rubellicoccus peritrichatus]|uniref:Dihydroorotate dehydrogenase-like protein n=1 Tax=Rubellicoccus peritrichatus TaxID=3080537 RepID=A0AAQ3LE60_9BACT|nr:dihydroorotate dehydrogenase-like protein [Puniceicoccus sp. CR14]WOO42997.1 dihydroorotate dehydrogenase-like protein [Puniceicoccus sp. CR14]
MNLKTNYLGLELPHPFIIGASPLGSTLDRVRRAEDAGAAAITVHSLFEEQIQHHENGLHVHVHTYEESFSEARTYFPQTVVGDHYGPEEYLEHLRNAKEAVDIPIIGSLNGTHLGSWTQYATLFSEIGVDAMELNLYYQPNTDEETATEIEKRFTTIVSHVRSAVEIPIAVKLSPFFSSLPNFVRQLEKAGANGVVLFNRFYQPDIDLDELETKPTLKLSDSNELLLRLRWLAILFGRYDWLSLACTGGVHTRDDALKAIMAGADCIQLVSVLLQHGVERIRPLLEGITDWMEENEYESLEQMKGSMSYHNSPNPEAIERANYLQILKSWEPNGKVVIDT